MSDPNVEVKFTAKTDGVESGAAEAAQIIQRAVGQMRQGFEGLGASLKEMQSQVTGLFSGMQAGLAQFNNVMFAVQNAISGGSMFKEFVASAMETTKESASLGKAFGITATEASYLRSSAAQVGVGFDTLQAAGTRLTRTLLASEDSVKNLGVATRDTQGHFRNTNDVMQDVNARLREFQEGTDRNVEGMKIYGREWANIAPLVTKFKGVTEESRQETEALNLVIGQEAVSAMANYKTAQLGVGEVMEGIKNTIGQALMPGLTDLANWFRSMGPAAVQATATAMNGYLSVQQSVGSAVKTLWALVKDAFSAIGDAIAMCFGNGGKGPTAMDFFRMTVESIAVLFIGFRIGIEEACNIVRGVLEQLGNEGRLVGGILYSALHLDWGGVKAAWADFKTATLATTQSTMDQATTIAEKGAADIAAALNGSMAQRKSQTAIKQKEGGERSEGKDTKDGKDQDRTAAWRDELRQKLDAEKNYFKDSSAEELAFWQNKLATETMNSKELIAVNAQVFALKRKMAIDDRNAQLAEIDGSRKVKQEELALETENLKQLKATQDISDAEYLQRLAQVHQAEIDAEMDAVNKKLAIVVEEGKQRTQLLDERARLDAKRNLTVVQDANATANAVAKSWQDAFKPLGQTLGTVFDGMIRGTMSVGKAVSTIASSMLSQFAGYVGKMAAQWLAKEAMQTAATAAGAVTRGGIEAGAAAESVMLWAATAVKNIISSAWEAMAGAYKAIVGIPYVGPFLAPVAAGTAFAAVAGMASSVASASQGYDIPSGVNPLTQLHEREMVLPAKQADAVRQMADGGGSGGSVFLTTQKLSNGMHLMSEGDLVKLVKRADRHFNFSGMR